MALSVSRYLALGPRFAPHLPGSHVRDPIHIVRPSPTIVAYAASRHSYRPRTVRSTVIGPTTIPRFSSPCHMRLRRSTYRAAPPARARFARRLVSSYPCPPFTARYTDDWSG